MLYVDFAAGGKEYKLRLNTRQTVALEKQIGCNPLAIFGAGDTIPTVTIMVAVLHNALQHYHHNITLTEAEKIFDNYLEDGNAVTDFLTVIIEIYKVSGIIKIDDEKN